MAGGLRGGSGRLDAGWAAAASVPSSPGRCSRRPDGTRVTWESRWHRKHPGRTPTGSTWWAPRAVAWWIGVLFAVGSVCFALGSFPPYATAVGTNPDNLTFFIGSIFFTTASFLLYYETASRARPRSARRAAAGLRSLFRVQHHRIDWWAAIIQFAGTLWFNRTTLSALVVGLGASSGPPPGLAARRAGLGLLPRLELAGLGRGVPRAVRLAPVAPLVVDHRC